MLNKFLFFVLAVLFLSSGVFALSATRSFSATTVSPSDVVTVSVNVDATGASVYGVDEYTPSGWTISGISDSGSFDGEKISWLFLDNTNRILTYSATAPVAGTYTFRGNASDGTNDFAVGGQSQIIVSGISNDTTAPVISSVSASASQTTATITWSTNENSNSKVYYGTTSSLGSERNDASMTSSHSIGLTGLNSNTTYYYKVNSCDASGNCANSSTTNSFTTQAVSSGTCTADDDLMVNYVRGKIIVAGENAPAGTAYTIEVLSGENSGESYSGTVDTGLISSLRGNGYFDSGDKIIFSTGANFKVSVTGQTGCSIQGTFANGGNGDFETGEGLLILNCSGGTNQCSVNSDCRYPNEVCVNRVCTPCVIDSQCNANSVCQSGICVGRGECNSDANCSDGNIRTVDQCVHPGTAESYCLNTEVNCLENLDCGNSGFFGEEYCFIGGIHKSYQNSTCKNAGTLNSYCVVERFPILTQMCNDGNSNTFDRCIEESGSAICDYTTISCSDNGQCDDGNSRTIDVCINPGTANSHCTNENVTCSANVDCGNNQWVIGTETCNGENVFKNYLSYTCNNAGTATSYCSNSVISTINQTCAYGCTSGSCNPAPVNCTVNSQCGTDGWNGINVCNNGNVFQGFVTYVCNNPGAENSYCSNSVNSMLNQTCAYGCANGNCLSQPECTIDANCNDNDDHTEDRCVSNVCQHNPITCLNANDCGIPTFVGSPVCQSDDVWQNYLTFVCNNAGQTSSSCSNSTALTQKQNCDYGCANGNCMNQPIVCSGDGECNDNNPRTEDKCLNPGTTISSCQYNPIMCFNNAECGTNGFFGETVCQSGNVFQEFMTYSCNNAGLSTSYCSHATDSRLKQSCQFGCVNGACLNNAIKCYNDAGCNDGNDKTVDVCLYPGTENSRCDYNEIRCSNDNDCNDFNSRTEDVCQNLGSTTSRCHYYSIRCFNNGECGTNDFLGALKCQSGNVYQDYASYTCIYPGTRNSVCDILINSLLKQTCSCGCSNGICLTAPANCTC